ncbi:unnamed protein product [Paramecium sonneborni]|uniref:Uncharacterized protein n=1 Tax=Paramecium sonneborni TaxID=65129 RepID=A0A8S1RP88_9CILI|nr:unnamed protein product [Paramecium sonneborni]
MGVEKRKKIKEFRRENANFMKPNMIQRNCSIFEKITIANWENYHYMRKLEQLSINVNIQMEIA